jgi:hypothetical protein
MVTYEVALDKAKRVQPDIDSYVEYPEAFVFTNSKVDKDNRDDNEVVIERKKGEVISYLKFVMTLSGDIKEDFKPI